MQLLRKERLRCDRNFAKFAINGCCRAYSDTGAKVVDKAKEVTKKVEKTVKEKVAEVKAAAADPEVYVQYQGNESNLAVITERIKKQYVEEGHKESDIKSLKIYLKPEDASAYYVINDNNSGKVFLF